MVKKSVQFWVCMTNQHWHQKPSMLASLLYVPEIKRGKNKEKKHYFLSIQCWVPSHITIQHVCMIKNGAQCWGCMTNTDTKILEFWLQCSMYKNIKITYRNAYLFITYHVMHICLVVLILNLLANFYTAAIKTCFSWIQEKKRSRSHWKGMYCICCMADYSTPHLSYQSLTTDYDACSTDSWRYHLTAFLIFECTSAKQCLLCETASHLN